MEEHRARAGLCQRKEPLTCGPRLSAARGEETGTLSGLGDAGPWAPSYAGPKVTLRPFLLLFISFSFFFYLNSDLFCIFCRFNSNQFKQIPKFFKSSKQCFKPVIN
jgi:hypothetical protein